jgi:hypothetical protein
MEASKMTKAGNRTLCRGTMVRHIKSDEVVTVTNAGIPAEQYQPKHSEQRDRALIILSGRLGRNVAKCECLFDFRVVEVDVTD